MGYMFSECKLLESLSDIPGFDTKNITDINAIFCDCS